MVELVKQLKDLNDNIKELIIVLVEGINYLKKDN